MIVALDKFWHYAVSNDNSNWNISIMQKIIPLSLLFFFISCPLVSADFISDHRDVHALDEVHLSYSSPAFADFTGVADELVHDAAFIGATGGRLEYYTKSGTGYVIATSPFTGTDSDMSGKDIKPAFADINGDNLDDAVIGMGAYGGIGIVKYYLNTGSSGSPSFNLGNGHKILRENTWGVVQPALVKNGGVYDLYVGKQDGSIAYFKNTGTAQGPVFTESAASNPFGSDGVVPGEASPVFVNLDADDDMEAYVGYTAGTGNSGGLAYFDKSGSSYTRSGDASGPLYGVAAGKTAMDPAFTDIDGDDDPDAFIGNASGNIEFYQNGPDPSNDTEGDIVDPEGVDLKDAIIALQIVSAKTVTDTIKLGGELSGDTDNAVGLAEAIYILRVIAGLSS